MSASPHNRPEPDFSEYDRDYGAEQSFQLYEEHNVLRTLQSYGLEWVEAESLEAWGGILYFTDPKPMGRTPFRIAC